jgi:hypothetical protein
MSLVRVLAGIRGERGRVCALGLLLTRLALVPLAHASPPDPAWIPGIYDDADYDDVVVAVASAMGVVESARLTMGEPTGVAVATLPVVDARLVPAISRLIVPVRAPPA